LYKASNYPTWSQVAAVADARGTMGRPTAEPRPNAYIPGRPWHTQTLQGALHLSNQLKLVQRCGIPVGQYRKSWFFDHTQQLTVYESFSRELLVFMAHATLSLVTL